MRKNSIKELILDKLSVIQDIEKIEYDSDLYSLGMTSLQTVSVMLALEEKFNFQFPPAAMGQETFQTINSIDKILEELL